MLSPQLVYLFSLFLLGEITYCRNNGEVSLLMHVNTSVPLWAFFDVSGDVEKIKILSTYILSNLLKLKYQVNTISYAYLP